MNRIQTITTPTGALTVIRPVAEQLLKAGVITGTLDGELRAGDAATVKAAVMAHHGVCDFCSAPGPAETFVVPDFDMPLAGRSTGGWAACDACADLIRQNKRKSLLDRSVQSMAFPKFSRTAITELHDRFWRGLAEMQVARENAKAIGDFVDERQAVPPRPVTDRDRRIEAVTKLCGLTPQEVEQVIADEPITVEMAQKLRKWHMTTMPDQKALDFLQPSARPLASIVPHWQEALDAQSQVLKMLSTLITNEKGMAEYFDQGINLNDAAAIQRMVQMAQYRKELKKLSATDDYIALRRAQVYSFNAETEAAIMEAAQGIPHDSPLSSIETPNTGAGWFWFGEPLAITASQVVSERTHALLWAWVEAQPGLNEPALMFSIYVKDEKFHDELTAEKVVGRGSSMLFPSTRWHWPFSMSLHEMLAFNTLAWRETFGPGGPLEKESRTTEDQMRKIIAALSLFFAMACVWFRQTVPGEPKKKVNPVLEMSPAHIERHARKRFKREHKVDAPLVHVVALRKTARTAVVDAPAERVEGARTYHCRWIVKGHPRLQACGPGRKDRKLIWIESHLAGPDDAPLKTKTTVFAVVR